MFKTLILAALQTLPIYKEDLDKPLQKEEQLQIVSEFVANETKAQSSKWPGTVQQLAAVVLTTGYHETGYSLRIHAGECKPWECDGGRARGLFQQHVSSVRGRNPVIWIALPGLDRDSTELSVLEATTAIIRARRQCGSLERKGESWPVMTFRAYAGRGCVGHLKREDARVQTYGRLLRVLTRSVASS